MRVGSLFTGYGGLDMAVGGELAWYAEIEPAACKVLAAHHPDVPNLGDVKGVDWSALEPIDVLTGGYPCQPFSQAGKRRGTYDERHLWPYVRDAISTLRPKLVVLENVRGHLSLGFDTVLGEMACVGYDARWGVVRASEAGAPHSRARLFVVANPNRGGHGVKQDAAGMASVARQDAPPTWQRKRARSVPRAGITTDTRHLDGKGSVRLVSRLGRGHHPRPDLFGVYAEAVARWEDIVGRTAPVPIDPNAARTQRLRAEFVEFMMGLPEGHVTGHGLTNAQALKMLGNGVVPQQAALALRLLGVTA